MLQNLTQTAGGAATTPVAGPPIARPVAMAPPPRSSSFGGADPRALFDALVQSFDSDGDGKLSLNEVNALNQGGLLARNFARIDSNADGAISGDELVALAPWGGGMLPSGDQSDRRGTDVRSLLDKLTDHLIANSNIGNRAETVPATRQTDGAPNFARDFDAQPRLDPAAIGLIPQPGPATLMESMMLALSNPAETDSIDDATGRDDAKPT